MFYLFYGDDIPKVRAQALQQAALLGGEYTTLTDEADEGVLPEVIGALSLFLEREVYVLDTLSRNDALFEKLVAVLPELRESANAFVIIEEKLGSKELKVFEKHAEKVTHFEKPAAKEFNVFSLTDALLARDKKSLWILLNDAWKAGKSSEEIIGTLHWQLKSARLALQAPNAAAAGLKPFVYDKAKRAFRTFTPEELARSSHELVVLYHDGHSGKRDIDRALEKWVLML